MIRPGFTLLVIAGFLAALLLTESVEAQRAPAPGVLYGTNQAAADGTLVPMHS